MSGMGPFRYGTDLFRSAYEEGSLSGLAFLMRRRTNRGGQGCEKRFLERRPNLLWYTVYTVYTKYNVAGGAPIVPLDRHFFLVLGGGGRGAVSINILWDGLPQPLARDRPRIDAAQTCITTRHTDRYRTAQQP